MWPKLVLLGAQGGRQLYSLKVQICNKSYWIRVVGGFKVVMVLIASSHIGITYCICVFFFSCYLVLCIVILRYL